MTFVQVVTEDGRVIYLEQVTSEDFDTQHFRAQIAERLWWALDDVAKSPVERNTVLPPTGKGDLS